MNKKALIKISLFSLTIALALSAVSLLFMHRFMSIQGARFRDDFLRFYAESLEQRLQGLSLEDIKKQKDLLRRDRDFRPPMPPPGAMMAPPPPMPRPHPKEGFRPPPPLDFETWIVDDKGAVLIAKRIPLLPVAWEQLPHPKVTKQVESVENFFRLGTVYMILKLDTESPTYLVVKEPPRPILGGLILTQALLTASMIVIALILAMASVFFYMRKKSAEAHSVLRRLEEGDLKARFEIHRLDEFGELMLDFNRMAEEIEKLVGRIHATERTRKQLLQEMGHDLRTPLTSLKTSFETLQIHYNRISESERNELFSVLIREIDYFKDLIEQLMTIASLDEPHFKASTEKIQVQDILSQEVRYRQSNQSNLNWNLNSSAPPSAVVLGDSHLILRLLRNGLDNAARYAQGEVDITVQQKEYDLIVEIVDDGNGADAESIKSFGQRREFRGRKITKDGHFSLGLGSVIMKAIADLHNGSVALENIQEGEKTKGARLTIRLPISSQAT